MMNICKDQTQELLEKLSNKIYNTIKEDCKCKSLYPIEIEDDKDTKTKASKPMIIDAAGYMQMDAWKV